MISNTATAEIIMLGMNAMPPNRGIGALCTFLRVVEVVFRIDGKLRDTIVIIFHTVIASLR